MSEILCPNCSQPINADSPITPAEVHAAVLHAESSWEGFVYSLTNGRGRSSLVLHLRGKNYNPVLVEKVEPVNMPDDEYARQGETYLAHLIFKVGEDHFRKTANVDSYGEETWDGELKLVKPVQKTITVFE